MSEQKVEKKIVKGTYDQVGEYNQDRVNGFTDELLHEFIEISDVIGGSRVLDYMAGNGNLTNRIIETFPNESKHIDFHVVDIAGEQLANGSINNKTNYSIQTHPTDVIEGMDFVDNYFDRVIRKSASHELLLPNHVKALKDVHRVMEPRGYFSDMGFLFDNTYQRDEFRDLALKKDTLANLSYLVENRHFLTKDELYNIYKEAGFESNKISIEATFEYNVDSKVLFQEYFKENYKKPQNEFDAYCMNNLTRLVKVGILKEDYKNDRIWIRPPAAMVVAEK